MRTFDYRHLPKGLFDGKAGDANVKLYEDHGKLELIKTMHPDVLDSFKARVHRENVESSTRIEGLYVNPARVQKVLSGDAPKDELESQIVGYSNALKLVEDGYADLPLSTSTAVSLYEALYAHRNLGRKSRYRKKDYAYVQVDGHAQAMPVSPITAFETPLVLGGACDSLAEAFVADACSPVILSAVFTVDFLCIRPFDEGNGRISRLWADLMLSKAGFDVCRYISLDRIIEANAMDYYNALNDCVEKWDRGRNDYTPYVLYWLGIIHEAYSQLFKKLEQEAAMGVAGGKSERVRHYVRQAPGAVTKRQIREAFSDISEATIEATLGKMVKNGEVEKLGASRSTSYRWI